MRRRIVTILTCLLLGAAVNVAVAWGIAYRHSWDDVSCEFVFDLDWMIGRASRPGLSCAAANWAAPMSHYRVSPDDHWPAWANAARPEYSETRGSHECAVVATGWPLLSMWGGQQREIKGGEVKYHAALALGRQSGHTKWPNLAKSDFLPLAPIWSGAIANTLVYAAALAACFVAPRSIRRAVRSRRNRCTRCGYPCGTSERCPECGQQR